MMQGLWQQIVGSASFVKPTSSVDAVGSSGGRGTAGETAGDGVVIGSVKTEVCSSEAIDPSEAIDKPTDMVAHKNMDRMRDNIPTR